MISATCFQMFQPPKESSGGTEGGSVWLHGKVGTDASVGGCWQLLPLDGEDTVCVHFTVALKVFQVKVG